MPMIGTATIAHAMLVEQPSVAFSSELHTSNFALPVPSAPVTP